VVKIEDLDNLERMGEVDPSGMLGVVADTPEMLSAASTIAPTFPLKNIKKVRQVVVAGMGGSAISGDIVAGLMLGSAPLPVFVNRDYRLPAFVGRETVVFALSYSGNTEETLSAVKDAEKKGASVVCVTSGGKLKEIAQANGYPAYLIPSGYQPRAAMPFLLVPLLRALDELGLVSGVQEQVDRAVELLRKLRGRYGPEKTLRSNPVKQLAKKMAEKIPVIFGVQGTTAAVAHRLKTQLNENSKVTALSNAFPELNHNEIVNLSALKRGEHDFCLVFLRDEGDAERVKKRIEITKSLIGTQLGGVNEVASQGKEPLERILSLIYFGDLLSVYLAVLRGVDPTPVEIISRLKKELMR